MKKSDFLTDLAKQYNSKIEAVYFCSEKYSSNGFWGMANALPNLQWYRILLNDKLLFCPIFALGIFFHEVGHIVLNHFGQMDSESEERAAEEWSFREMGTVDQEGKIKKENAFCYVCISIRSRKCLKDLTWPNMTPEKQNNIRGGH